MSEQSSILRLPPEILRHIAHFADPLEGLIPLTSVSRRLRNDLIDLAYRHISFPHPYHFLSLLLFFRSICRRKSLANYVRNITISFSDWSTDDIDQEDIDRVREEAVSLQLSLQIQIGILTGSAAAVLLVLLYRLPRLKSLNIDSISCLDDSFFKELPHMRCCRGLQSLRSVSLTQSALCSKQAIIPLLTQNLSSIHCNNMFKFGIHPDANDKTVEVAPRSSHLEKIFIDDCELEETVLETMIKSSRRLKYLTLRRNPPAFFKGFTLSHLERTLRECCRDTLECLEVGFENHVPQTHMFTSLSDFSRLQQISCPISLLLTATRELEAVLPSSVVSLSFSIDLQPVDDGWWCSALLRLLEQKRRTVPCLLELSIKTARRLAEQDAIQKACNVASVIVRFIDVPPPPPPFYTLADLDAEEVIE